MSDEIKKALYLDNWPKRRKVLYAVLGWAMSSATYVIGLGHDTRLNETAFVMLIGLIISLVGSYVFGAIWDDSDKRKAFSAGSPESKITE
jgi:hypothetical protein